MTTQEKLHPGEGYRLLAVGETYREGDETAHTPGVAWGAIASVFFGGAVGSDAGPMRRKVRPAPTPGWRIPDGGEAISAHYVGALGGYERTPPPDLIGVRVADDDNLWFVPYPEDPRLVPKAPAPDAVRRPTGCRCQWEEGDSPCPVHGEDEAGGMLRPVSAPEAKAAEAPRLAQTAAVAPTPAGWVPRAACRVCGAFPAPMRDDYCTGCLPTVERTESAEDRYRRRLDAMLAGMRGWRLPPRPEWEQAADMARRCDNRSWPPGTALDGVRDLYRPRAEVGCDDGSGDDVAPDAVLVGIMRRVGG